MTKKKFYLSFLIFFYIQKGYWDEIVFNKEMPHHTLVLFGASSELSAGQIDRRERQHAVKSRVNVHTPAICVHRGDTAYHNVSHVSDVSVEIGKVAYSFLFFFTLFFIKHISSPSLYWLNQEQIVHFGHIADHGRVFIVFSCVNSVTAFLCESKAKKDKW